MNGSGLRRTALSLGAALLPVLGGVPLVGTTLVPAALASSPARHRTASPPLPRTHVTGTTDGCVDSRATIALADPADPRRRDPNWVSYVRQNGTCYRVDPGVALLVVRREGAVTLVRRAAGKRNQPPVYVATASLPGGDGASPAAGTPGGAVAPTAGTAAAALAAGMAASSVTPPVASPATPPTGAPPAGAGQSASVAAPPPEPEASAAASAPSAGQIAGGSVYGEPVPPSASASEATSANPTSSPNAVDRIPAPGAAPGAAPGTPPTAAPGTAQNPNTAGAASSPDAPPGANAGSPATQGAASAPAVAAQAGAPSGLRTPPTMAPTPSAAPPASSAVSPPPVTPSVTPPVPAEHDGEAASAAPASTRPDAGRSAAPEGWGWIWPASLVLLLAVIGAGFGLARRRRTPPERRTPSVAGMAAGADGRAAELAALRGRSEASLIAAGWRVDPGPDPASDLRATRGTSGMTVRCVVRPDAVPVEVVRQARLMFGAPRADHTIMLVSAGPFSREARAEAADAGIELRGDPARKR
ncbi:hypothetical protein [Rhizosaccharibacter radicis]|uniref:Restriction endonuclease n=1 Tax=Rhizosaccharibacter radicis TaxID=2782605 RepID=A0ABT1W0Z0_9PROT|nr:hypothetical protein [Acetobacteraceae bacterium KSS12]